MASLDKIISETNRTASQIKKKLDVSSSRTYNHL